MMSLAVHGSSSTVPVHTLGAAERAVDIRDLRFGWRPGEALLCIDRFEVRTSERVFIKGPSGSGKSTLLALIGGVLVPQCGSVRVNGIELTGQGGSFRDRVRADHIGFIFQMFNLVPYLSVLDNVLLPAGFSTSRAQRAIRRSGSIAAEARRLLTALGLQEAVQETRSVVELSQGQQQRVAAARALFGSPALVIADEPTSALDADARERFIDLLLSECRQAAATLLFVSHDTTLSPMFDRTVSLTDLNSARSEGYCQ